MREKKPGANQEQSERENDLEGPERKRGERGRLTDE